MQEVVIVWRNYSTSDDNKKLRTSRMMLGSGQDAKEPKKKQK